MQAHDALAKAAYAERAMRAKADEVRREVSEAARLLGVLQHDQDTVNRLAAQLAASNQARDWLPQIVKTLREARSRLEAAAKNAPSSPDAQRDPVPARGAEESIALALAQLGKPYVWGAAGPDTFDCSGLTKYVWEHVADADVHHLVHYAESQFKELQQVPLDRMLPGDLVFFWDPTEDGKGRFLGHVGIYLGEIGGQPRMIDAPHTGDFVRIDPIWSNVAGAARVTD